MEDKDFRILLERMGYSWKGYRKVRGGVKKRLGRFMQAHGYRDFQALLDGLERDEGLRARLEPMMSVSISRFFRDRRLWEVLQRKVIPGLAAEQGPIRVWSAGCACGEEVYSFRILWEWSRYPYGPLPRLDLLGTDINPLYLKRAEKGIYSRSSLKEVPEKCFDIFFEPLSGECFQVRPDLRHGIRWREHNLLSDPPGKEFHIVFLRNNLLTYYDEVHREPPFRRIIQSLRSTGLLVTGSNERPPPGFNLEPGPGCPYLLRRHPAAERSPDIIASDL